MAKNTVTDDGYVRFCVTDDGYGNRNVPQPSSVTSAQNNTGPASLRRAPALPFPEPPFPGLPFPWFPLAKRHGFREPPDQRRLSKTFDNGDSLFTRYNHNPLTIISAASGADRQRIRCLAAFHAVPKKRERTSNGQGRAIHGAGIRGRHQRTSADRGYRNGSQLPFGIVVHDKRLRLDRAGGQRRKAPRDSRRLAKRRARPLRNHPHLRTENRRVHSGAPGRLRPPTASPPARSGLSLCLGRPSCRRRLRFGTALRRRPAKSRTSAGSPP